LGQVITTLGIKEALSLEIPNGYAFVEHGNDWHTVELDILIVGRVEGENARFREHIVRGPNGRPFIRMELVHGLAYVVLGARPEERSALADGDTLDLDATRRAAESYVNTPIERLGQLDAPAFPIVKVVDLQRETNAEDGGSKMLAVEESFEEGGLRYEFIPDRNGEDATRYFTLYQTDDNQPLRTFFFFPVMAMRSIEAGAPGTTLIVDACERCTTVSAFLVEGEQGLACTLPPETVGGARRSFTLDKTEGVDEAKRLQFYALGGRDHYGDKRESSTVEKLMVARAKQKASEHDIPR
ncbi:MAG: hypothetical protein AAGK04_08345, partial [Planctomycetota bacterium]